MKEGFRRRPQSLVYVLETVGKALCADCGESYDERALATYEDLGGDDPWAPVKGRRVGLQPGFAPAKDCRCAREALEWQKAA